VSFALPLLFIAIVGGAIYVARRARRSGSGGGVGAFRNRPMDQSAPALEDEQEENEHDR
jgi:hypothetical protein